jgi:hypothetical protein
VLDVAGNSIRTGALQPGVMPQPGTGLLASTFQFYNNNALASDAGLTGNDRWNPITAPAMLTGETFSTTAVARIVVPTFDQATGALLTELPIHNIRLVNVAMNTSRGCIGFGRATFNSCSQRAFVVTDPTTSMPYGSIEGDFVADEARSIMVTGLGSLYNILVGGSTCATVPPTGMNCTPPDTMVDGATTPNAWHVVADFAAVGTNISGM